MPSRSEILSLFRSLLRVGRQFPDYNIREYSKRRTLDGFRMNKGLTDPAKVSEAFAEGKAEMEIAQRVVVIYKQYAPKAKSIMELKLH